MAMHVKLEFGRNRSGVIAQQQQQTPENAAAPAATSHASGGNAAAVLPAGGTPPTSCAVDDYFKVAKTSAFIVDGKFRRVALRFPNQLLRDAREVLRAVRTRVQTLETEVKKSGEGMGGRRSAVVIFIDNDNLVETSFADRASEQCLQPAAVVDYGCSRVSSVKASIPVFYVFGRDEKNGADPRRGHHAWPPNPPVVDFSTASTFASFGDLLDTVSIISKDEGVRVWLPHKILAVPGSLGSSLDTDKLLQVCLDCVGSAEAENPPSMTSIAIAAAVVGGSQPSTLLRTQRELLQATVEFLWRAINHGGMVFASGLVILPTARPSSRYGGSAPAEHRHPSSPMSHREFPDSPSARYSGLASAERREPVYPLYRRAAPGSGSKSATKRSWVDNDGHESATKRSWVNNDERDDDKRIKSSSSCGSRSLGLGTRGVHGKAGSGGGATGPSPKMLVTIVTIPEQKACELRRNRDTERVTADERKVYSQDEARAMAARVISLERGPSSAPATTATAADPSHGLGGGSSYGKSDGVGVQQGYSTALSILGDAEVPNRSRHGQSSPSGLQFKSPNAFTGRSSRPPGFSAYIPGDDGVSVPKGHHHLHNPGPQAQAFVYDSCRRNGLHSHGLNWRGYAIRGDYGRQQPAAALDTFLSRGQPGPGGLKVDVSRWHGRSGTTPRDPSFDGSGSNFRLLKKGPGDTQDADEPLQEFRRCLGRLKPHKTLSNLRAWKLALDKLKATRNVGSRANITLTLNGDPKQGIQPVVPGCPMSTANRWATHLRQVGVCKDTECCKEDEPLGDALKKHPALPGPPALPGSPALPLPPAQTQ